MPMFLAPPAPTLEERLITSARVQTARTVPSSTVRDPSSITIT
jgi:hypothetical protein